MPFLGAELYDSYSMRLADGSGALLEVLPRWDVVLNEKLIAAAAKVDSVEDVSVRQRIRPSGRRAAQTATWRRFALMCAAT